jgi:hypothetical protein
MYITMMDNKHELDGLEETLTASEPYDRHFSAAVTRP